MEIYKRAWASNGEQLGIFTLVSKEHVFMVYETCFGFTLDGLLIGEEFSTSDAIWKRFA